MQGIGHFILLFMHFLYKKTLKNAYFSQFIGSVAHNLLFHLCFIVIN